MSGEQPDLRRLELPRPRSFRYEERERVGVITLTRPDRFNALTFAVYRELTDLFAVVDRRAQARLMLIPPHDPQFRRNRERVIRDAERENILLSWEGEVKVTDFGVARLDDSSRTRTGLVLGTPSFMSPEQMAGRRTDGRSDLYSLGVMLFQLLTAALPHQGETMAKLMHQIANEPAPDIRTLRPELPQELADVVSLALEKRPEVRYADGGQMAQDLRAGLAVEGLHASGQGGIAHHDGDVVLGRNAQRKLDIPLVVDLPHVGEHGGGGVLHLQAQPGGCERAGDIGGAGVGLHAGEPETDRVLLCAGDAAGRAQQGAGHQPY